MSSVGYASRLNQDADVGGTLGEPEVEEDERVVEVKATVLANLLSNARGRCVAHTGAGISRDAGIPDFRGPNGVWTRRASGLPAPACETTMAPRRRRSRTWRRGCARGIRATSGVV